MLVLKKDEAIRQCKFSDRMFFLFRCSEKVLFRLIVVLENGSNFFIGLGVKNAKLNRTGFVLENEN